MSGLTDIAYVRFRTPDTDRALRFLCDFGLAPSSVDDDAAFLRCSGPAHHVYVLERGPTQFLGFGFEAESEEVLEALADGEGVELHESPEPGGGIRVILHDPDGYPVDVVYGMETLEAKHIRPPLVLNYAHNKQRVNETQRPEVGPAEIKRLGHVGIKVENLARSRIWYTERFGLKTTDILTAGPDDHEVAAFLRLDRGAQPVDHHSVVMFESSSPTFHHCAFETQDYDAVETAHDWLRDQAWAHSFGVGRHLLGSQVFDYWLDPWGQKHEHFADGDLFDDTRETERHPVDKTPIAIWGPPPPPNFVE